MSEKKWNGNMHAAWAQRRELAVEVGMEARLLDEVDRILADEDRAVRAPDSWRDEVFAAIEAVNDAMLARVGEGNVPAAPFYKYRREVDARLAERYTRIDAELGTAPVLVCEGYVLLCMLGAAHDLKDLLNDIPNWREATAGPMLTASKSTDPEEQARAIAEAVFDIAEVVYKPVLRTVYRMSLRKYGKQPPKSEPTMIGQFAAELRNMWKADPNHYLPIDALIDDDAIFIRTGVAHKSVRFETQTKKLVVTDKKRGVSREFTVDRLKMVLAKFYRTVRPMWLVLFKHSGKLAEEKASLGLAGAPAAPATP